MFCMSNTMPLGALWQNIDEYVKSYMTFDSLDDAIEENMWIGGTLIDGQLSGSSTRNTLADQSRFDINAGDFTIEFDFTPNFEDNGGSNRGLLSFGAGSLGNISYFVRYNAGLMLVSYPSIGAGAEIPVYNTMTLTTDQKYHIVFQRKAGIYDLLVDHTSVVTARNNAAIPYSSSSNELVLGALDIISGYSEYMSGKLDNFNFSQGIARY